MKHPQHLAAIALTLLSLVAAAGQPAQASDFGTDIFAISLGSTTGIYGIAMAIGAGASSSPSTSWQVHAYVAGSLNLAGGITELVVGAATDRDIWIGMGIFNALVGATSIAMGVFNAHKQPTVTPWFSRGPNGESALGFQLAGSF